MQIVSFYGLLGTGGDVVNTKDNVIVKSALRDHLVMQIRRGVLIFNFYYTQLFISLDGKFIFLLY